MSENSLIPMGALGGEVAVFKQEDFDSVAKAAGFMSRFQLYGGSSDACKEGLIGIGHYGIPRSDSLVDDLGTEVDVLVVHGRPKAMHLPPDGSVIVKYNKDDDGFKDIVAKANAKQKKYMYGPEFLLYIPSRKEYATYFMASATARNSSAEVFARLGNAATFKAKLIQNTEHKWHGPVCTPCSTPLEVPPLEELQAAVAKFMSAKDTEVELAATTTGETGGRAR